MDKRLTLNLTVIKTELEQILPFRTQFLQENNFQIRYDAVHTRNWSDPYLLRIDGQAVGYGSVKGKEELSDRDAIFEFYVVPPYRKYAGLLFTELVRTAQVSYVECQSNDLMLSSSLFECCKNIHSEVVLFADQFTTDYQFPELLFRPRRDEDVIFGKKGNDLGKFVLEKSGDIVAVGGFLTHYNPPFADLHMEVRSDCRNQGMGSFLLQEIKRECYLAGRVPAARCNISNKASKACLIKAGFQICGYMLTGTIRKDL